MLNPHRHFRRKELLRAVEVRAELHALFPDLPQLAQVEDGFVAGPEKKMIGVSENDSRVETFEHLLRDGLDRARSPDRHEDGRLDLAVGGPDPSGARLRGRVFIFDVEKLTIH